MKAEPGMPELMAAALRARVAAAFAPGSVTLEPDEASIVAFRSPHPQVGVVSIQCLGDELLLILGRYTHVHFGTGDESLSPQDRADELAEQAVDFLQRLFADEIEFHGDTSAGGCRPRNAADRSWLSKRFFGAQSYVWSGPLS